MEEESKTTALTDEDNMEEDEEEEEAPTEAGASDDDDKDEGSAADEDGGDKDDVDDDRDPDASGEEKNLKKTGQDKKCVPGIIYLGHIPPRLRPKHLRNLLSVYGEIGRIFLQPEDRKLRRKKKKSGSRQCNFTEGWVEFRDKRVAKRVAASLHNTPMGTRKRQRFFSDLWSIKYLHRFQWTHLCERLAYEQMVLQQRLRTEVSQVKKETNFYLDNVEKSARMDKLRKKREREGEQVEERTWDFTQRQTEEEIQMRKKKKKAAASQKQLDKARLIQEKSQSNVSLLAKIFNTSKSE